ncbi:MAG: DUF3352 domain-containing protein [Verrucomicrobiota bacterium]
MMSKQRILLTLVALASLAHRSQAEAQPSAAEWLPAETVVAIEIAEPQALLDPLLSPAMIGTVTNLPAYQKWTLSPQYEGLGKLVGYLETQLGTDWKTGLGKLLGGGVTLGIGPGGETVTCVDAKDEKLLEQLNGIVRAFTRMSAMKQNQQGAEGERDYRGVMVMSSGPKEAHAVIGGRLLFVNQASLMPKVLDLRAENGDKSLSQSPLYQTARKAVGKGAVGTVFVNLQVLKKTPKFQEALAKSPEPLAALILAELRESVRDANWLALGLYVKDDTLSLRAVTDSFSPTAKSFAIGKGREDGVLPPLNVPTAMASLSLYRDLHAFYAAKDELFPERTSGLVFFENMMGIFFSGMHLTEGVLAEAKPDIRLVVAPQNYGSAQGTPEIEVPAFAVVMRLRHPQEFGEVVEEAWQKAIGMASFTRGQKALPGFIIDRVPCGDTRISVASFRPPKEKAKGPVDIRYNFRPSLARPGEYLILSSTDDLARQLVAVVTQESAHPGKPMAATHSLLELKGAQIADILDANREQLVLKNMVDKGKTREQADNEMELFITALHCVHRAKLNIGTEGGHPLASLELQLKQPEGAGGQKAASAGSK